MNAQAVVRAGSRRILFVGEQWRGSNAASVANALRRAGHLVAVVEEQATSFGGNSPLHLRALARLLRSRFVDQMGQRVCQTADSFGVELMVVYKGACVPRWALQEVKARGVYCVNVYPDTGIVEHGPEIPQCLPVYDRILHTKSFGPQDLRERGIMVPVEFVPHGYDPDVHRVVTPNARDISRMRCDVGFIGAWSPKKARYLRLLAEQVPQGSLRIWGGWALRRHSLGGLTHAVERQAVTGDLYALAINCTSINLGLLYEGAQGGKSDVTTARTFEIPGCGGFMLHERTDEVLSFFSEGTEIGCFGDADELVHRVHYYLKHERERETMRWAAHQRCVREYSVDRMAERIVRRFVEDTCP